MPEVEMAFDEENGHLFVKNDRFAEGDVQVKAEQPRDDGQGDDADKIQDKSSRAMNSDSDEELCLPGDDLPTDAGEDTTAAEGQQRRGSFSSFSDHADYFPLFGPYVADMNPFKVHKYEDNEAASIGDEEKQEIREKQFLPQGDVLGRVVCIPNEEQPPKSQKVLTKEEKEKISEAPHSVFSSGIESFKYLFSVCLLFFSVVLVMAAILAEETTATSDYSMPSAVAFCVFWFLILWLAMMEGGQGALVGLQPVDKSKYAATHPLALKTTELAHKGDNMERFIVGRQFLVVLAVFVTNLMATVVDGANILGLSPIMHEVFLASGVAVILVTIMLGQLTAQVNASSSMLDFINNYFMLFTTYVSLAIEMSGLLHSVYLVQIVFAMITGEPVESKEPRRSALQTFFFWIRVLASFAILAFAFFVTLTALFEGKTAMWDGVPESVSVILFFLLMSFVGLMEGMQIALFAVVNMPEDELKKHATAYVNCQLTFDGQNLQAFLIGRQICVTCCTFVVARVTTISVDLDAGEDTVLGVSRGFQEFFNTGLLGAIITTLVGSLAWRIVASSFPIAFLSNPLIYYIIRLCLMLEKSGLCSASWVFARYQKLLVNYQPDEVYLEGARPHTTDPVTRRDKDIDRMVTVMKFTYSLALLVFAVVLVMAAIFGEKTNATDEGGIPTIVAFVVFWLMILWLGVIEGIQGVLVGLQPVDKSKYASTHPVALLNTEIAHRGDNMKRFIVGRQFLVVLIVFVTNFMATAVDGAEVLGLPDIVNEIFLATGIAVILVPILIGQLTAQINAANCMLDFVNNYFALFTTYLSLAIEMSGLLHSVYLVQLIFSMITGKKILSKEPPRNVLQNVLFWVRVIFSLVILGFSFAVTLAALFEGKTTMWDGVPNIASVIMFFLLMCFVGLMEGMQIALFAVVKLPEEALKQHPIVHAICELAFREENLQAFLIGRQICVTCCMFVVARITTIDVDTEADQDTIFGVPKWVQHFFNTGLLGAVITTVVASLGWRVIASSFPIGFLSNPLIYLIIRLCLVLEASGLAAAAWVLGRWHKLIANYQPDEVYLEGAEPHGTEPVTRRDKDIAVTVTVLKYIYSVCLLAFSVIVVMAAVFTGETTVADSTHPIIAFIALWGLVIWLAIMEGGQGALVGLQPIERELYVDSHPVTHKCTSLAHKGDNMKRFIVGRQFLVVLVVFVINLCGAAIEDASVLGLSDIMVEIFLASGVALVLLTITIGQLTAQVNAANSMLDFINTYFMFFTVCVSLIIEYSGLLHCVYLVQVFFSKVTGKPIESDEPPLSGFQKVFFWLRVFVSLGVLIFAFAVTLAALFDGKTAMWEGVPESVSVILFFVLMCFVGLMEGMQIALFAVVNLPEEELKKHSIAYANCKLTFSGTNFQAFLIGRQICVTICMFLVARITTVDVDTDAGEESIFGVGKGVQEFLNTGLLGAVITTVVASLAWRIIASSFPLAFMSNPLIYLIIRLCLLLEASGLCSVAWLLALVLKQVAGYQLDKIYIGSQPDDARCEMEPEEPKTEIVAEQTPMADGNEDFVAMP